jgi:hypothetical protein
LLAELSVDLHHKFELTYQAGEKREELPERLAKAVGSKASSSDLDKHSLETTANHAPHKGELLLLPEVSQRRELEALADMLDTEALVVGQDSAGRDGRGVGVLCLRRLDEELKIKPTITSSSKAVRSSVSSPSLPDPSPPRSRDPYSAPCSTAPPVMTRE